jgi:hypothetical protein
MQSSLSRRREQQYDQEYKRENMQIQGTCGRQLGEWRYEDIENRRNQNTQKDQFCPTAHGR